MRRTFAPCRRQPRGPQAIGGDCTPAGARRAGRFLADAERSGAPVAVLDVPLLFETGGERRVDAVAVVSAPADVQRARTLDRAGMTAEKFEALLQKQMPDDEKRRRADFVVDTSQSLDSARAQVRAILASVGAIRACEPQLSPDEPQIQREAGRARVKWSAEQCRSL
jgi:dephospho-CoA kinase